jgi:mono/diheme cytochrome c family protein
MKFRHSRSGSPLGWARLAALAACLAGTAGCRQDMHDQPKYKPLRPSTFFADGSSARPHVEGTVARGTLQEDEAFFTGKAGTRLVRELPLAIDDEVMDRGQERFNIYCTPCHDATGGGNGMVVQRGYRRPPSLHEQRLRDAEAGHFFDVMTNGFGAMPDYRAQIPARDRWAIVAYIRALQLQQPVAPATTPGAAPADAKPASGSQTPQGGGGH